MLTLLPKLTLMSQVLKLILQLIRQEIPEGEALEVQEPEEVLNLEVPEEMEEALEAEEALEVQALEEVQHLEILAREEPQAQAEAALADEELEAQEQAAVVWRYN
jgi:hypothetical protein